MRNPAKKGRRSNHGFPSAASLRSAATKKMRRATTDHTDSTDKKADEDCFESALRRNGKLNPCPGICLFSSSVSSVKSVVHIPFA